MTFFGMGPLEILVILVVALIVFGPDKLPQVAMQVGRAVRDFRRWTADLTSEFRSVTQEFSSEFEELRSATQELQSELRGVQSDLANEMRMVSGALQLHEGQPVAGGVEAAEVGAAAPQTWAPASPGAATTWTNGASQEAVMSASPPPVATKDDPRVDVSLFDLDDLVVMPRTSRATNGHADQHGLNGENGHAVAELATTRPTRQPRPDRSTYTRPLRRGR